MAHTEVTMQTKRERTSQERRLAAFLQASRGEVATCPRCGANSLELIADVPFGPEQRDRWVRCGGCGLMETLTGRFEDLS
jgi:ribosomal protein S27AE